MAWYNARELEWLDGDSLTRSPVRSQEDSHVLEGVLLLLALLALAALAAVLMTRWTLHR